MEEREEKERTVKKKRGKRSGGDERKVEVWKVK